MRRVGLILLSVCWFASVHAVAQESVLGPGLTPYGAELKGNDAGTIPPWDGGLTADKMPPLKSQLEDPFADEQPLFVITAANMGQYTDQLSTGQQALLKRYPDSYRLPVYPTHRTAAAPQWVYDNIAKNHQQARLVNDGNGIEQAVGGVAFPVPLDQAGQPDPLKILWNHLTRWRGIHVKADISEAPVHSNGNYSLVTASQEALFVYYDPKKSWQDLDNKLGYYMAFIRSPARLAGGGVLVHETIDRVKEPRGAWVYNSGTRRVRRAPSIEYDMPVPSAENLITADDVDMFNGAPDRFDWRFVGKQELYIPYNNFRLSKATANAKTLLQKGHINPEPTRYELHRVWVIEGTVKKGIRHLYSKRRFYIDEDSWSIVQADQYDARGQLWRVHLSYLVSYYHVPVTWGALTANYELESGSYFAGYLDNANGMAISFDDDTLSSGYFSPQSLRRMGR
ncbi:DUF1329 domain-containing protein [Ketobacter sp.]|uniref:DUF1329 domain-containing protein n=1 Tax=Ketobacter sp. TaxID=2083498 RepID=UPI000F0E6709|nr:DUF1329 domain-containing protein [Ketobacter sp.]RLT93517.1 MAG: DUF1329 domain-containing protein [Ketobacter sp.]